MSDIVVIKRALESRAKEIAEHLLPRGVLEGREWCVGSVQGEPGRSLKVCVSGAKAGTWCDFAEGGEGGDLIDLWQAVKGQALTDALDDIRGMLGLEKPRFEKREKTYQRPAKPKCQTPQSAVLSYLTGPRKLTLEAVKAYRIGEDGREIVIPYLLPDGGLALVKWLKVDRTPDGKKLAPRVTSGCEPILFGWQAVPDNAREVTITEGEIDAMTAWDYGRPALSVPFGGGRGGKQQWIESDFDRLLRFETIFLAVDMDAEGDAAAEEIANRLGRHRCRRVQLPRKDLNECRQAGVGADEIRRCFEAAKTLDPAELVRAGEFTDDVIRLFWPSDDVEPGYRLPWRKVGDRLVFRRGELTLWTGATGAGKSQLLSHALVEMGDQGARICIASLEMKPGQLLRRMVKQAGNVDRPTEAFIRDVMTWFDGWAWVFEVVGKVAVGRLLDVFEYARARHGCDVFVIDSLMRLGVGAEDYEGQERAVFEVVSWAIEKGVHVHLVAHARKTDRASGNAVPDAEDVKGTSEIASNAANIIGIWRNRKLEDDLRRLAEDVERGVGTAQGELDELADKPPVLVNVAKQRNGDWEGKFGLWFNAATYQYRSAHDDRHGHKYVSVDASAEDAA